jgi:hypothetical protein
MAEHQVAGTPWPTPPSGSTANAQPVWRQRRFQLLGGAAILVLAVVASVIALISGSGREMTVNYTLFDSEASCSGGSGGYSDIGPGNPVTVKNGEGKVLAASSLGADGDGVPGVFCTWTVVLDDVPADEDFYSVSIGRRGEISYSQAELESDDWTVELSIGD